MFDKIEQIESATIQHGKENNRIYLMDFGKESPTFLINRIEKIAVTNGYSKLFCKVPQKYFSIFLNNGYQKEAFIPNFYNGKEQVLFMAKFLDTTRARLTSDEKQSIKKIIELSNSKKGKGISEIPSQFNIKILKKDNISNLIKIYGKVFATYPFPIYNKEYISKTMDENIVYFGVFKEGILISAASAEMDISSKNVEMTDFATHPDYLGHGLAVLLLDEMEKEMKKRGIKTAYTIARALSAGMNITFAKMNYDFTGTLIHNTNISGSIENMNIWYKNLIKE